MNTTELTPKQTQAQQSEKLRTILFGIVAAVIFLLWGMRVYADETMYPGDSRTISFSPIGVQSPDNGYPNVKVVKGDVTNETSAESAEIATGISVSIPEDGIYEVEIPLDFPKTTVDKVFISVGNEAVPGTYTIIVSLANNDSTRAYIPLSIAPSDGRDKSQSREGASTETPVVYVPKTPAELYAESLDMLFPSGHTFVTLSEKECIWVIDTDRNTGSLWQAGAKIGSFSVQAADGSVKKLYMYEPIRTADGKVYLQVGVNTNDGQSYDLVISDADREAFKQMGLTGICINNRYIDL